MAGKKKPFDPNRCGTYANYAAHRRRGERPCDACRAAYNEYNRRYQAGPTRAVFDWAKCGTHANYNAHLRHGVPACEACRKAHREYRKSTRKSRAKATAKNGPLKHSPKMIAYLAEMYGESA